MDTRNPADITADHDTSTATVSGPNLALKALAEARMARQAAAIDSKRKDKASVTTHEEDTTAVTETIQRKTRQVKIPLEATSTETVDDQPQATQASPHASVTTSNNQPSPKPESTPVPDVSVSSSSSANSSSNGPTKILIHDAAFQQHLGTQTQDHIASRMDELARGERLGTISRFERDFLLFQYQLHINGIQGAGKYDFQDTDDDLFDNYGKVLKELEELKHTQNAHQVKINTGLGGNHANLGEMVSEHAKLLADERNVKRLKGDLSQNEVYLTRIQELEALGRVYAEEYKNRTGVDLSSGNSNANSNANTNYTPAAFREAPPPTPRAKPEPFLTRPLGTLAIALIVTTALTLSKALPFAAALGIAPAFILTAIALTAIVGVVNYVGSKKHDESNDDIAMRELPGNSTRNIFRRAGVEHRAGYRPLNEADYDDVESNSLLRGDTSGVAPAPSNAAHHGSITVYDSPEQSEFSSTADESSYRM